MRARSIAVIVGLTLVGCFAREPDLRPSTVSQQGGVELVLDTATSATGPAIVLVDGVPARSVVVAAPGVLRMQLPSLPRTGAVDVVVSFADGTTVRMDGALEVVAPPLVVRARD